MTGPRCSRVWIVEAVRDGRVKGEERTAFERHVKTCTDCADELRSLDRLSQALRQLPAQVPDAVSVRRQTQRLMADFDGATLAAVPAWRQRARVLGAAAAVVVLAAAIIYFSRTNSGATGIFPPMVSIEVSAEPGGRWYRTDTAGLSRVELLEGSFSLRIKRSSRASRVIIVVPDGEIEDFGTVLSVSLKEGRTEAISVVLGEVAVRLRALPEFRLRAGGSFVAPDRNAPTATESSRAPPMSAWPTPGEPSPSVRTPVKTKRSWASVEPAKPTAVDPGHDLEPSASSQPAIEAQMAEDGAYLDVIRLLRAGKDVDARNAARRYLLRFPTGFRRVEVLNVATGEAGH